MLISETLRVALQSISGNLFRAVLTMLGIVIGVAAVITIVALGTGAQQAIDQQVAAFGGNILSVNTSSRLNRGVAMEFASLSTDDAMALAKGSELFAGVVPELASRMQVKYGNQNLNIPVLGTTANYPNIHGFSIAYGRMFSASDDSGRRRVAVLGAEIPEMLNIQPERMIGQKIQIRSISFDVIGVLETKGSSGFNNPDDDVWIPLNTAQFRVAGDDRVSNISVRVRDDVILERAMVDIERILRREHGILPGKNNDFVILNRKQFLDMRQEATEVFTFLLAGIASVSLLVGGIGIMNIMLVTVTERTREIGIRKALGATRANILLQFLVESMTLCLIGGLLGLGLGASAAYLANEIAGWQTVIAASSVVTAVVFSAGVGLLFGIWPASRAARLDPIDALRHE